MLAWHQVAQADHGQLRQQQPEGLGVPCDLRGVGEWQIKGREFSPKLKK